MTHNKKGRNRGNGATPNPTSDNRNHTEAGAGGLSRQTFAQLSSQARLEAGARK